MPGLTGWNSLPVCSGWRWICRKSFLIRKKILANVQPRCRLERISSRFSDGPARRKLFSDLDGRAKKIVVASEGLLIYFTAEEVASLASDLASPTHFRNWMIDLGFSGPTAT